MAIVDDKYRFHDTSLSRFVLSASHAVSIDERRTAFAPTLWDNVDSLNINAFAANLPYGKRPYQQNWFPGRHPGVGGGQDDGGLSIAPLLWIAEGAEAAGLEFDRVGAGTYGTDKSVCPTKQTAKHGLIPNRF